MSNPYISIIKELNPDPAIIKLSEGFPIPYIGNRYKIPYDSFYPFPPAFIPLFVDNGNPSIIGLLKHFFLKRDTTIVNYDLETGMIYEKARNGQQFIAELLLQMDMLQDGLTPEIREFAQNMDFSGLQAIDDHAEEYGDIPKEFHKLEIMGEDPPLEYAPSLNNYKGDFPASDELINSGQLTNACSFEVPQEWAKELELPIWMDHTLDKKLLFENFLNSGDLDKAWLTLNSRGWIISDAIKALDELRKENRDPLFSNIAAQYTRGWQLADRAHLSY